MQSHRLNKCPIILSIYTAFTCLCPAAVSGQPSDQPPGVRFVEVSGSGTICTTPTEAVIVLGVRTWNKDIRTCYTENNRILKQVLDVATKHNIEKQNVQTSEVSVSPTFPSSNSSDHSTKPDGYTVQKQITLVTSDFSVISPLLADAIESGANTIEHVDLRIANPRKFKDEARDLALSAAQEKARAMATQLNVKLGKALTIKEIGSSTTGLRDRYTFYPSLTNNLSAYRPTTFEGSDESLSGDISKGQLRISSAVTVTFEIID